MKKKIKITESQYNKLQQRLMETPFNQLYPKIKDNDIIEILNKGVISKFKVTFFIENYIIMDGITPSINQYTFAIDKDALYKSNFEAKKILKKDFNPNEKIDFDTWPSFVMDINSFKQLRGNKVINVADINGQSSFTPPQAPEPAPVVKPTPEPEETTSTDETESYEQMIKNINAELKSDEIFKQALFKQPSFWERLNAEIKGTTPKGTGIIMANQLANSWKNKSSNEMLNANFRETFKAKFKPLNDYSSYGLNKDEIFYAKVNEADEKDYRNLEDVNKKYNLLVKKNISLKKGIPNSFLCDLRTYEKTPSGGVIENNPVEVELQFFHSNGYQKIKK